MRARSAADPMTRILPVIAATLVIALVAASVASAKTTFTIRGAGFGHGVGMSQYGAMGFAQQGRNAAEILAHYYTGTALGTTDPNQQVRVLLVPQTKTARITGARAAGSRKLDPSVTYTLKRRGISQVELSASGRRLATFSAPLQVAGDGGVTSLERPGELPRRARSSSPTSSTASRSSTPSASRTTCRAWCPRSRRRRGRPRRSRRRPSRPARTRSRRPRATTSTTTPTRARRSTRASGSRSASTNQAIADTRGQVVTYQGQPIVTYFFSTSGGRTESVENTNLGDEPKPWLKSVEDPYDDVSPRHRWTLKPSKASVAKKLGGLVKGSFKGIRVTKRGESPRIMTAEVVGSRGVTRDRRADAARAARALRHVGVVHGDQERQGRRVGRARALGRSRSCAATRSAR